jgi:Uma2 family endonuclease
MAVALTRRRLTLDEYHRMIEAGILTEADRIELIRGEIVEMTPHRPAPRGLCGQPVPDSEPQPDLALLRPVGDFYAETPFRTEDVLLMIEVADTSVTTDRAVEMRLYAERGIREAWVIDLPAGRLERYRGPASEGYRECLTLARGQSVTAEAFPDLTLLVDDLLG